MSHFPFFINNVGLSKLIIKSKLKGGISFVYEIPKKERFLNFAKFNKYEDLGFYPKNLRIEMCSNLVFLTQNRADESIKVNLMLLDTYYEIPQVALF